jgi:hypothetical protein
MGNHLVGDWIPNVLVEHLLVGGHCKLTLIDKLTWSAGKKKRPVGSNLMKCARSGITTLIYKAVNGEDAETPQEASRRKTVRSRRY